MNARIALLYLVIIGMALSCDNNDNIVNQDNTETYESLGLVNKPIHNLLLSADYLYACAGLSGLYRLCRNAQTPAWEYLGFDSTLFTEGSGVTSLLLNEQGEPELVGLHTRRTGIGSGVGIYRTDDDGQSWYPSDSGIAIDENEYTSSNVHSLARDPNNANTLFAGIGGAIYRSSDRGRSWRLLPETWRGSQTYAIAFGGQSSDLIWAGGEGGWQMAFLLKSSDGGSTWEYIAISQYISRTLGDYEASTNLRDIAADPSDANTVYLCMGVLVKSEDAGKTWKMILSRQDGYSPWRISLNPDDPQELITTGAGVYHSTDGGSTWVRYDPPEGHDVTHALAVDWVKRVLFIYAFRRNGVYKMEF